MVRGNPVGGLIAFTFATISAPRLGILDPVETLATPMEAAELLLSAGAGKLLGGLSSGEAVSDLTPHVDADEQGGVLKGIADYLRGHIRIIIVVLLIVVLVLYVICRKSDKGSERFPFNDGGFGDYGRF